MFNNIRFRGRKTAYINKRMVDAMLSSSDTMSMSIFIQSVVVMELEF